MSGRSWTADRRDRTAELLDTGLGELRRERPPAGSPERTAALLRARMTGAPVLRTSRGIPTRLLAMGMAALAAAVLYRGWNGWSADAPPAAEAPSIVRAAEGRWTDDPAGPSLDRVFRSLDLHEGG